MVLLSLARLLASLISLVLLVAAGYLLWSWMNGEILQSTSGDFIRIREDWRLWIAIGLAAWCLFGRLVVLLSLAKSDTRPTRAVRGEGKIVESASGSMIYFEQVGEKRGVQFIFTHGWGMDSTFWYYAMVDLGRQNRLIVWDLPGLGRSKPSSAASISLSSFAADLATLIDRCSPDPVVLVGHSIGGMTIQTLLRDRPEIQERLAGVVLLNTTYTNPLNTMVLSGLLRALQRPLLEPMAHLTIWLSPLVWLSKWQSYLSGGTHLAMRLGCGKFVTRSQLEHVALLATRASPAVEARGDLAMFRWDATDALRDLRVPALVIGGDMDVVTKLEASRAIANENPRAMLRVVEGVNHMGPMERADVYNALIADFAEPARVKPAEIAEPLTTFEYRT